MSQLLVYLPQTRLLFTLAQAVKQAKNLRSFIFTIVFIDPDFL